jgi:hypothetical protein
MQRMVKEGLSHRMINQNIGRIKRMFKWGVSRQVVRTTVFDALRSVEGLSSGRSDACEPAPILPVEEATVEQTLPHLPRVIADMVRLQRLLG